jgi:hypothetical protein
MDDSTPAQKPKFDVAAMAKERLAAKKAAKQTNYESMLAKIMAENEDDEKPAAGKKAKGKAKSTTTTGSKSGIKDAAAKLKSSPGKVDKLRSEVQAAGEASSSAAGEAAAASPAVETAAAPAVETVAAAAAPAATAPAAPAAAASAAAPAAAPTAAPTAAAAAAPAAEAAAPEAAAPEGTAAATPAASDAAAVPHGAAADPTPAPTSSKPGKEDDTVAPRDETQVPSAPAPPPPPAAAAAAAAAVPETPKVYVRYNHKNSLFKVVDGRLDFSIVDAQYCLSCEASARSERVPVTLAAMAASPPSPLCAIPPSRTYM